MAKLDFPTTLFFLFQTWPILAYKKPTVILVKHPLSLSRSSPTIDTSHALDYDKFLSDSFDANGYADAIISTSGTGDKAEVAAALSNLSFSIASLDKQIQNEASYIECPSLCRRITQRGLLCY